MKNSIHKIKRTLSRKTGGCPNKEEFALIFLKETNREKKFRLLDHIFTCSKCMSEFKILIELWKKEHALFEPEIQEIFEKAQPEHIKTSAQKALKLLRMEKRSRRRMAFSPVRAASLLLAATAFVLIFYFVGLDRHQDIALERDFGSDSFQTLEPWDTVSEQPIRFRWTEVAEAKEYALEILDSGLEATYRKEGIRTAFFKLPNTAYTQLSKSKTYFWKVIATLRNGQIIESEFGKFYLKGR
ncbi:MAG: hypothetical protein JXB23_05765 [Candidatus Aminicenantes bacterium]|nr:hypothetical protein [Candidatus Aminicenantes bacterium]